MAVCSRTRCALIGTAINFAKIIALPLCSASALHSKSATLWPGATVRPACCNPPRPRRSLSAR